MATIGDNIRSMAQLVATVKRDTKLSEGTILRIVDMNFALAQSSNANTFAGDEDFPIGEPHDDPTDLNGGDPLTLFPSTEQDIDESEGYGSDEPDEQALDDAADALATIKPN